MPRDRRLSVTVQYACESDTLPLRAELRRWARAAFIDRPLQGGEITIRLVTSGEAQDLNQTYRGKPYATNILSFPYSFEPVLSGDLVICADIVRQEAQEQCKPTLAHFAHLVVHGMLHLQGYDHEGSIENAEKMETIEREIMVRLGFDDPYAET